MPDARTVRLPSFTMHRPNRTRSFFLLLWSAAAASFGACTGEYVHRVGGTVTGLESGSLTLTLNGTESLTLTADGFFVFPTALPHGATYEVAVGAAPANTQATVMRATGVLDRSIADVAVTIVPTFAVGGTLSGLASGTVSLRLNGGAPLAVSADGPFTFSTRVPRGSPYSVTVDAPAPTQITELTAGTGTIGNADVTTVAVDCANWRHPASTAERHSTAEGISIEAAVAIDEQGNGVAAWLEQHGGNWRVFKSELQGGVWTRPSAVADAISPDGSSAWGVRVAMSGAGDAVIVWVQTDSSYDTQVFKSERRAGVWTHPVDTDDNISPDGSDADEVAVAGDRDGNVLIAWTQDDLNEWRIYKSEYRAGVWSHPTIGDPISPVFGGAYGTTAAFDGAGAALIGWSQWDGISHDCVFKSEYRNGVWSHPVDANSRLSLADGDAYDLALCGDGSGNFVLAWTQSGSPDDVVLKAECRGGAWLLPMSLADAISPAGSSPWTPRVAARGGEAVVVWTQQDANNNMCAFASERRANGWTNPATRADHLNVAGPPTQALGPRAGMDAAGNTVVVWLQWDGMVTRLAKSERIHGTWRHPTSTGDAFGVPVWMAQQYPELARNGRGQTIVFFPAAEGASSPSGGGSTMFASEYR